MIKKEEGIMKSMQPPKGMKDWLPEEAEKIVWMVGQLKKLVESYGYEPMFTPSLEYLDAVMKKAVSESIRDEIYWFKDKGGRDLALRFDLTTGTARALGNVKFAKPFKRYTMGWVWRYDQPQAMRYREFLQFDYDIFGSDSIWADAEVIELAVKGFSEMGIRRVKVKINSRAFLDEIFDPLVGERKDELYRIFDKYDKIGEKGVRELLRERGFDEGLWDYLKLEDTGGEGYQKLVKLYDICKEIGLRNVEIDVSIVRGLDYYTGNVFEAKIGEGPTLGAGGRFDKLLGLYGEPCPAVGFSFGITRLVDLIEKVKKKKVFVAVVGDVYKDALKIREKVAKDYAGVVDISGRKLRKQLEYANKKGFDVVVIVGEKDLKSGLVTVKDMRTGEEMKVEMGRIRDKLEEIL